MSAFQWIAASFTHWSSLVSTKLFCISCIQWGYILLFLSNSRLKCGKNLNRILKLSPETCAWKFPSQAVLGPSPRWISELQENVALKSWEFRRLVRHSVAKRNLLPGLHARTDQKTNQATGFQAKEFFPPIPLQWQVWLHSVLADVCATVACSYRDLCANLD